MKTTICLLAAMTVLSSFASHASEETGFSVGNDFTAIPIRGELTVFCRDGNQSDVANVTCRDVLLAPAERAFFLTDPAAGATQVILTATHESGKAVTKSSAFDPAAGQSKARFNLWLASLFQRPLLDFGVNRIHYTLKSGAGVEREGDFTAKVETGATRYCRHGIVDSHSIMDCRNTASACDTYFREQGYCR